MSFVVIHLVATRPDAASIVDSRPTRERSVYFGDLALKDVAAG
jgi:hypothetical protein